MDLSYVAGFFDGEGSIGIYKNGSGNYFLRTQMTQNINPVVTEVFTELHERWGGNLSLMRHDRYQRGTAYNWQLNGKRAADFLREVLPLLRLKREQAEVAINWIDTRPSSQRDARGRVLPARRNHPDDVAAEELIKALKKHTLAELQVQESSRD